MGTGGSAAPLQAHGGRLPAAAVALGREMELLAWCGRAVLDPVTACRITRRLEEGVDAHHLLALAERHRLLPLLCHHLRQLSPAASALPNWPELEARARHNAACMLGVTAELLSILQVFEDRGIPAVPFKGPTLAQRLYGNVALRPAGDLDILVRRADYPSARAALLEQGYQPRHLLRPGGEAFLLRSRYAETFDRPGRTTVELHWAFTNGDIGLTLGLEELLPRTRSLSIGARPVQVLGEQDLLLVLCVHGGKHRWDRLEWLGGVAELVRQSRGIDWERMIEQATALGVRRLLLLGLLLAHDLLEAPVPFDVLDRARRDDVVVRLGAQLISILVQPILPGGEGSLSVDLFRYRLRERRRDRLRFLWYRFTTPSQPERWTTLVLGSRLIPVHGLSRPFRLLGKAVQVLRWCLAAGRLRNDTTR